MMTTPTPEAFMAQRDPEELGEDQESVAELDPLTSIAKSLQQLVAATVQGDDLVEAQAHDDLAELQREYDEIEALHDAKQALIEQVLAICKPSVSKLANQVRAVLEPPVEATPDAQPAADAEVEEWRAYARDLGYTGPDIDKANRSQIRSMLGVPHPPASAS